MDTGRLTQLLSHIEQLFTAQSRGLDQLDIVELRRLGAKSLNVRSWLDAFDTRLAAAARSRNSNSRPSRA